MNAGNFSRDFATILIPLHERRRGDTPRIAELPMQRCCHRWVIRVAPENLPTILQRVGEHGVAVYRAAPHQEGVTLYLCEIPLALRDGATHGEGMGH